MENKKYLIEFDVNSTEGCEFTIVSGKKIKEENEDNEYVSAYNFVTKSDKNEVFEMKTDMEIKLFKHLKYLVQNSIDNGSDHRKVKEELEKQKIKTTFWQLMFIGAIVTQIIIGILNK